MNQLKKLFAVAALTACVLPVAAQYPVIPDSVKIRGEEQQKEIDRKSDEAWAKALPVCRGCSRTSYKPWASAGGFNKRATYLPFSRGRRGEPILSSGWRKWCGQFATATIGPGTLREACETGGARIVVLMFRALSGTKTPINVVLRISLLQVEQLGDEVCRAAPRALPPGDA